MSDYTSDDHVVINSLADDFKSKHLAILESGREYNIICGGSGPNPNNPLTSPTHLMLCNPKIQ